LEPFLLKWLRLPVSTTFVFSRNIGPIGRCSREGVSPRNWGSETDQEERGDRAHGVMGTTVGKKAEVAGRGRCGRGRGHNSVAMCAFRRQRWPSAAPAFNKLRPSNSLSRMHLFEALCRRVRMHDAANLVMMNCDGIIARFDDVLRNSAQAGADSRMARCKDSFFRAAALGSRAAA
jgi:hypothetical protein